MAMFRNGLPVIFLLGLLILPFVLLVTHADDDQFTIWTKRYDNERRGVNEREFTLNPSNVNPDKFGKIFMRNVVGQVYAQVLYMPNVLTRKGKRNLIYVATMANYVYAFDADDPDEQEPIWEQQLGSSAPFSDMILGIGPPYCHNGFTNIAIEVGILSTPVIDTETNIMYLVTINKDSVDPIIYHHRIFGLDVATGEVVVGPTVIEASVPKSAEVSVSVRTHFVSKDQNQRPALALSDDIIYVAFGSFCDTLPYHGWILGYDAKTLSLKRKWCGSPNKDQVSLWMSGDAIAVDENGSLYFATANGEYNPENLSYGNSIVRIDPHDVDNEGLMKVKDHYRPQPTMERLGTASTGVSIVPGTKLITSGTKEGWLLLMNREQMNGEDDNPLASDKIVQLLPVTKDNIHQAPTLFSTGSKNYMYTWPESSPILQLDLQNSSETSGRMTLGKRGTFTLPDKDMPGGMLTLSANGKDIDSAIVWASRAIGDAKDQVQPGVLHAYAAGDVSKELWTSLIKNEDEVGAFPKFVDPTVIAGRVVLPTLSFGMDNRAHVNVYGLYEPRIVYQPKADGVDTLSITVTGKGPFTYQWYEVYDDGSLTPIPNSNSRFLEADHEKQYVCRVSSPYGEVTSKATLKYQTKEPEESDNGRVSSGAPRKTIQSRLVVTGCSSVATVVLLLALLLF